MNFFFISIRQLVYNYYTLIWLIFVSKGDKPLIGFIGLGNMGNHMARNLVSKGYPVLVYDVNTAAVDGLKQAGKYFPDTCSSCIRVDHLINIFCFPLD